MPAVREPPSPQPVRPLPAVVYRTLMGELSHAMPEPLDNTPEARMERDEAAIAEVAMLAPVDPAEMRLAISCVSFGAWTNAYARLMTMHGDDLPTLLRLTSEAGTAARAAARPAAAPAANPASRNSPSNIGRNSRPHWRQASPSRPG